MRGSPLIRAVFIIAILLLAAIPLWNLTHKAEAVMDANAAPAMASEPVGIQLTFTHPALEFQVYYLGKLIWEQPRPGSSVQKDFPMEFPKDGIDLRVAAKWAPGTPETAVRVTVTHKYGSIDKTAWADKGAMDQVLTFMDPQ